MPVPVIVTLVLVLVALVLFAIEKLPVDVVGIILVLALIVTRVLTVQEGMSGFGNDIIITIGGLFILVGGLVKTGIVDDIGRRLHRVAGDNEFLLTALVMVVAAGSAAVLKNTTTTAMFLPVVMGLAVKAKLAPSKLLMPLAFGAILGGSCTLIGTSTNLAVSGAIQRYGQPPLSMFELSKVGIMVFVVGLAYMLVVGRKLLPNRGLDESLADRYRIREYVSELLVLPRSRIVGKTLAESQITTDLELNVLGVIRGQRRLLARSSTRIEEHDRLIVEGKLPDILRVKEEDGLEIKPDFKLNDTDLVDEKTSLFELIVMRNARLVGQSLKSSGFRQRHELTVLAINRHGENFIGKLSEVRLKFGDVLLVQGTRAEVEPLVSDGEMILLEDVSATTARTDKRRWAIAAFLLFLALSLSKIVIGYDVPLAVCVLSGVLLLLTTKTVRYSEMYSLVNFRLLVLIACMMSFGVAMEKTGTDKYLAALIETHFGQFGPTAVLAGFFVLTVGLTQPMSNQAAALVVLPVAVKTAAALGLNPRTFIIAVTFAASFSFITPLEPACVLVYSPGRYRFMDFVKVGTLLTVVVFVVAMLLVPRFWPY